MPKSTTLRKRNQTKAPVVYPASHATQETESKLTGNHIALLNDLFEQGKLQRSSLTYEQVVFFDEDIAMAVCGHRHLQRWPRVKLRGPSGFECSRAERLDVLMTSVGRVSKGASQAWRVRSPTPLM